VSTVRTICYILAVADVAVFGLLLILCARIVAADLRGRGEDDSDPMDEACALTRPFDDFPTSLAEREFSDQVENWMKERAK
jgi:hypothetical protein